MTAKNRIAATLASNGDSPWLALEETREANGFDVAYVKVNSFDGTIKLIFRNPATQQEYVYGTISEGLTAIPSYGEWEVALRASSVTTGSAKVEISQ